MVAAEAEVPVYFVLVLEVAEGLRGQLKPTADEILLDSWFETKNFSFTNDFL